MVMADEWNTFFLIERNLNDLIVTVENKNVSLT